MAHGVRARWHSIEQAALSWEGEAVWVVFHMVIPDSEQMTEPCDGFTDGAIAFLLSMLLPGVGQLWKQHWSAPWWLAGGAVLLAVWELWRANVTELPTWWRYGSYVVYCLIASIHAVRCRDGGSRAT